MMTAQPCMQGQGTSAWFSAEVLLLSTAAAATQPDMPSGQRQVDASLPPSLLPGGTAGSYVVQEQI
jgi:hypothetical protein